MRIESEGILISVKPFNERDVVVHIFSKDFGVMVGVIRGGAIGKNKPLVGQYGRVSWVARLDSQLGTFHFESEKNLSVPLIINADLLKIMNSVFSLVYTLIPEREEYKNLYESTLALMENLKSSDTPLDLYLQWELGLLKDLGYALDFTKCSGCQKTDNLIYLSPKTGRAVCAECGAPYADKLYKMPVTLHVTRRFIDSVCSLQGVDIPIARKMF